MQLHYFLESKWNSISSLKGFLKDDFENIINYLARKGIYKEDKASYRIEYVGIISYKDKLLAFLPKFLKEDIFNSKIEKQEELKLIMEVLKKASKGSDEDFISTQGFDDNQITRLALIEELLKDYIEYDLYEKEVHSYELNGNGEIDWEYTMENEQSYIFNNRPIYLNYYTNEINTDDSNYIRRLHQYCLVLAIEELQTSPIEFIINDLIDIPILNFNSDFEGFEDIDYMIKAIDYELKEVFSDRKIRLLNNLKLFISKEKGNSDNSFNLWGTRKFWAVWEDICKVIFNDQYANLKDKIEKPKWIANNSNYINHKDTLIPDVLYVKENNLHIIDAKYYNFTFDKDGKLKGKQPVLESITKQFSYELAFKNKGFNNIYNYFCIPVDKEPSSIVGKVEFSIYDLEPIKVMQLDHREVFYSYLKNGKLLELLDN